MSINRQNKYKKILHFSYPSSLIFAFLDTAMVVVAFIITILFKPHVHLNNLDPFYYRLFTVFLIIWMVVSHFANKFRPRENNLKSIIGSIVLINLAILGIITVLMFIINLEGISRFIVFGTLFLGTFFECIIGMLYYSILHSPFLTEWIGPEINTVIQNGQKTNGTKKNGWNGQNEVISFPPASVPKSEDVLHQAIIEETSEKAYQWIAGLVDLQSAKTLAIATSTRFNIDNLPGNFFTAVINLKRINDILRINKFFESVNAKLPIGGIFIGCGETYQLRKEKILNKYPPVLNYMVYSFDFIIRRILPKLRTTRKLYFLFSRGKNRLISRTETLGRLFSCGFEVLEETRIDNLLYWKVKKIKEPAFDDHPTYGLLIRLNRIGKYGKEFNVYKFRTMHAYSEYLQKYVYDMHGTTNGDKADNDFRVTTFGAFIRKYWIDEFPMIINLLKGDLKIFGVRPLSKIKFSMYPAEIQKLRLKHKPGLIPPFYADIPNSFEELIESEQRYLEKYDLHPFTTDCRYLFRALYNIFIRHARSK